MTRSTRNLHKRAALAVGKLARIARKDGRMGEYMKLAALRRELYEGRK